MPLLKFITLLDPHFHQAYSFGGYHLAINLDKPDEGINFLKEGIKYNPDDYDLNYTLGFVLWKKMRNYYAALKYTDKAITSAKEKVDLLNTLRLKTACQEKLKDYSGAIETLEALLRANPGDKVEIERIKHFKDLLQK